MHRLCSPEALKALMVKPMGCFIFWVTAFFDPKTGKKTYTVSLGANVESSPAVYDDDL